MKYSAHHWIAHHWITHSLWIWQLQFRLKINIGVEGYILQCFECIVRRHVTAGIRRMVACMQFRGLEVHQSWNGYAWIQWLRIAGSPYSDSLLHSLQLSSHNSSFEDSLSQRFAPKNLVHIIYFRIQVFVAQTYIESEYSWVLIQRYGNLGFFE